MPLTTSQGERSHVTFHDDVKMGSNQRVGLMTSAVRAWQQQDQCRSKNSQVNFAQVKFFIGFLV